MEEPPRARRQSVLSQKVVLWSESLVRASHLVCGVGPLWDSVSYEATFKPASLRCLRGPRGGRPRNGRHANGPGMVP